MKLRDVFGSSVRKASMYNLDVKVEETQFRLNVELHQNGRRVGQLEAYLVEKGEFVEEEYILLNWIESNIQGGGLFLYNLFMEWIITNNHSYIKLDSCDGSYIFHFKMGAMPVSGDHWDGGSLLKWGLNNIKNRLTDRPSTEGNMLMEIKETEIQKWKDCVT